MDEVSFPLEVVSLKKFCYSFLTSKFGIALYVASFCCLMYVILGGCTKGSAFFLILRSDYVFDEMVNGTTVK
jgi:hypothetical protein